MEQYSISRKQSSIIVLASLILHMSFTIIMFRHNVDNWAQKVIPFIEHNEDEYLVQQILSAGQQPATVHFQDEPPSGHAQMADDDEPLQEVEQAQEASEHEQFEDTLDQEELVTKQDSGHEQEESEPTAQPEEGTHMAPELPDEQTKPRRRKKSSQRKKRSTNRISRWQISLVAL